MEDTKPDREGINLDDPSSHTKQEDPINDISLEFPDSVPRTKMKDTFPTIFAGGKFGVQNNMGIGKQTLVVDALKSLMKEHKIKNYNQLQQLITLKSLDLEESSTHHPMVIHRIDTYDKKDGRHHGVEETDSELTKLKGGRSKTIIKEVTKTVEVQKGGKCVVIGIIIIITLIILGGAGAGIGGFMFSKNLSERMDKIEELTVDFHDTFETFSYAAAAQLDAIMRRPRVLSDGDWIEAGEHSQREENQSDTKLRLKLLSRKSQKTAERRQSSEENIPNDSPFTRYQARLSGLNQITLHLKNNEKVIRIDLPKDQRINDFEVFGDNQDKVITLTKTQEIFLLVLRRNKQQIPEIEYVQEAGTLLNKKEGEEGVQLFATPKGTILVALTKVGQLGSRLIVGDLSEQGTFHQRTEIGLFPKEKSIYNGVEITKILDIDFFGDNLEIRLIGTTYDGKYTLVKYTFILREQKLSGPFKSRKKFRSEKELIESFLKKN